MNPLLLECGLDYVTSFKQKESHKDGKISLISLGYKRTVVSIPVLPFILGEKRCPVMGHPMEIMHMKMN